jgi:lipoate---protein ligase
MALDSWLFEQHCRVLHPPTLRFYTWSPIAISLGYHQHHYPEHWRQLTWNSQPVDLVRRPSGGRAVLHQGDLTYAVIVSGMPGNRLQAYQTICAFLIQGWRSLGIDLHYGQARRGYIHHPNCFGTATNADLLLPNNTKLIGSAQLRRGDAILQHGSMQLEPNPVLFKHVFGIDLEPPQFSFNPTHTPLISTLIEALITSASECFGITFVVEPLSETEWQAVKGESAKF